VFAEDQGGYRIRYSLIRRSLDVAGCGVIALDLLLLGLVDRPNRPIPKEARRLVDSFQTKPPSRSTSQSTSFLSANLETVG
jgi:hypothetical protein